jgi:hypothetical protein
MPKHNSQSAANLPSYYKKEVSSSLGRNIDSLAKQFNKEGNEEFKNDQQIDNGRYFIFVVWGSFRVGQHITCILYITITKCRIIINLNFNEHSNNNIPFAKSY